MRSVDTAPNKRKEGACKVSDSSPKIRRGFVQSDAQPQLAKVLKFMGNPENGALAQNLNSKAVSNKEAVPMNARKKVIPTFDLQKHHSKVELSDEVNIKDLAIKHHVFPLKVIVQKNRRQLLLAMTNPNNHQLIYDIEFRAGMTVVPVYADDIDIQWLIQKHYYGRPLTPTPSDRPQEVTHDVFEQLTLVTDVHELEQAEWASNEQHAVELDEKN